MSQAFIDYAAYYDLIYQDKNYVKEADYIEKYNLTTVPSLLKGGKIITNIQKITEIVKGE